MSAGASPAEHGRPGAEEDRVSTPAIVAVGLGSILAFVLFSALATGVLLRVRGQAEPAGPQPLPAEVSRGKIGLVEQRPFEEARQEEARLARQRQRLESYGWVDRPRGLIRLPIDRAMELVAAGALPAGTVFDTARLEAPPP